MGMRCNWRVWCGVGCGVLLALAGSAAGQELVRVPGTQVQLPAGPGFRVSRVFVGLEDAERGIEVVVSEFPVGYPAVVRQLDRDDGAAVRRYVVERREEVRVGGRVAMWVQGRMPPGMRRSTAGINPATEGPGEARQWLLVGTAATSVLVTASYPLDRDAELSADMREMLLGTVWDPNEPVDVTLQVPFTMVVPNGLRLAGAPGSRLVYSEDGRISVRALGTANMSLQSMRKPSETVTADDVRRLYQGLSQGQPVRVTSVTPLRVGDLEGFEVVGEMGSGSDAATVYAAYLFNGPAMYQILGQVQATRSDPWLERFRLSVRTVRPRP